METKRNRATKERTGLPDRNSAARIAEGVALLADVDQILAVSLDPESTLTAFARLVLPRMADWCVVDILEEDGALRRWVHAEPSRQALAHRLDRRHGVDPNACQGASKVLRTGHAEVYPALRDVAFISTDDRDFSIVRELGLESAICVPLVTSRGLLGAVTLISADARRPYHPIDLVVVRVLARRAAASLERARLYQAEQLARKEAEAANRAKDEFLAMLGHELRNPIGAIRNAVRVLNCISTQDGQELRLRGILERQTEKLTRLIEDLLDVAQLTSGKTMLQRGAVDLRAIATRSVRSLLEAGSAGTHQISLAGDSVIVEADPTRLEQIIENLVQNAVKHTAPGGRIDVTVERAETEAVLRVRDTGEGIPAELLPRVFDLFFQAPPPLHRARGGLGIGLSVVQRLVGLQGGTVSASSPGPGQGSEFVVRLPLALETAIRPEPAQIALPAASPRHILIIEDNSDFRDALRNLLEMWGHHVEEATDGQRGLERVLASRPEIALIDVGLPDLDGYTVARAIRAAPLGERVCLVAVTGHGQLQDRGRALDAGFDAHLIKPVDEEELMRLLESVAPERSSGPAT